MSFDEPDVGPLGRASSPRISGQAGSGPADMSTEAWRAVLRQEMRGKRRSLGGRFFLFLLGMSFGLAALLGGFMYGDYYGRQHAQFDNPVLREHYAGQCYQQFSKQLLGETREAIQGAFSNLAKTTKHGGWVSEDERQRGVAKESLLGRGSTDSLASVQGELQGIRLMLQGLSIDPQGAAPLMKRVEQLLSRLEANQIQLVSERCPASARIPRSYGARE